MSGRNAYGPRTIKRSRRSKAELAEIDDAIYVATEEEYPLTVRRVYYRTSVVSFVPKTEPGYRLVGRQLVKLRRSGRVPYDWITDGTRLIRKPSSYSAVDQMLDDAAASYRRGLWRDQDVEVIVLVEKDAISGVIYPVTEKWDVELGIVRGYSSESFAYSVAEGIAAARKPVFVYQVGDHDPSGIDAWRDLKEKVRAFAPNADVTFERLAVTEQQIVEMSLPTRPTKKSDSRAGRFAGESVEVDAIPAPQLRAIVEAAITQHIDENQLRVTQLVEKDEREMLKAIVGALR